MKKYLFFVVLYSVLTSCDYVLKKRESSNARVEIDSVPEVGIAVEKDKNGCVEDAGYKWSIVKDSCIRVVDEGFRLNPINDLSNLEPTKSAYVVLGKEKLQAEVYLQDLQNSIYFKRNSDAQDFKEKDFTLSIKSGYILYLKDSIIFRAAETAIKPVVGTDIQEK